MFVGDHLVHVLLVPILSVSQRGLDLSTDPGLLELGERRGDHRIQMRPVDIAVGDLRREHDLPGVDDGLGVEPLDVSLTRFQPSGVGVGHVDLPVRHLRWLVGLRWTADAMPTDLPAPLPGLLVFLVGQQLCFELLLEPLRRDQQPLRA